MRKKLLKWTIAILLCFTFVSVLPIVGDGHVTLSYAEDVIGGNIEEVDKSELGEPNWAVKLLAGLVEFIVKYAGLLLDLLAPSPEDIYMPGSPFLFNFSLTNFFGRYSAVLYGLTSFIATMMIAPYVSYTGIQIVTSKSGFDRNRGIENAKYLLFAITLFWFLPEILNAAFKVQGIFSESIAQLFKVDELGGFGQLMKEAAFAEEATLIDAIIYCGSTIFSLWLMFNYIAMSLGFTGLFVLAPVVIVTSQNDKGTVKELWGALKSYWLTPLIDMSLLGGVTLASKLSATELNLSALLYNMMMIALLWSVVPMRTMIKRTLKLSGSNMSEMMGTGMMMAGVGIMSRMSNRKDKPSYVKKDSGGEEKQNSAVGSSYPSSGTSEAVSSVDLAPPSIPPNEVPSWQSKVKSDFGNWAANTFTKENMLAGSKSLAMKTSAIAGGGAGAFFGPAGVAAGGALGSKLGGNMFDRSAKVARGVGATYNYVKSFQQPLETQELAPDLSNLNEMTLYQSPSSNQNHSIDVPDQAQSFKKASDKVFSNDMKRTNVMATDAINQAFSQVKRAKNEEYSNLYENASPSDFGDIDIKVKMDNSKLNEVKDHAIKSFSSHNQTITLDVKSKFEEFATNNNYDLKSAPTDLSVELQSKREKLLRDTLQDFSKETGVEIDVDKIIL